MTARNNRPGNPSRAVVQEDAYAYSLANEDGTIQSVTFPVRLRSESEFYFGARTYEVLGGARIGSSETIACVEIRRNSEQVRRAVAASVVAFLNGRGFELQGLGTVTEEFIGHATLKILEAHFEVRSEIQGRHLVSGRPLRIDAILTPKNLAEWKNRTVAIGIEFKSHAGPRSKGNQEAAVMAQCLDYSFCEFPGFSDVLVFACPLPPYLSREAYLLRFLARYGVGHVAFHAKRGVCLKLGDFILWCERDGVGDLGRRSMLSRKYGNRDVR
jgi:hypothetical protein